MIFLTLSALANDEKFMDEVTLASETHYKDAGAKAEELLAAGKLDEANQLYLSARPEKDLIAADCFVLGNVFYKIAPDLSAKFLGLAYQAMPENPEINLEWAMVLHRDGKTKEAANSYLKSITKHPDAYLPHVLVADCLVRNGDLKEAIEHWKKANHPQHHTGIDFAICEIYGPLSPDLRHNQILKAVKRGETARLEELIALAGHWDRDWWNSDSNTSAIKRSLALADDFLKSEPERLAQAKFYASTFKDDAITSEWLREKLTGLKLILGDKDSLPTSSIVADRLCALAMEHKLVTKKDLLKRYEDELRKRALKTKPDDLTALNLLAALLVPDDADKTGSNKLAEIDQAGWEEFHDARFAASLLAGKMGRKELDSSSPLLKKTLDDFPEDPWICKFALQLAAKDKLPLKPYIIAAIKAEFRHLSVNMGIIKDSYGLKALFAMLEQELN